MRATQLASTPRTQGRGHQARPSPHSIRPTDLHKTSHPQPPPSTTRAAHRAGTITQEHLPPVRPQGLIDRREPSAAIPSRAAPRTHEPGAPLTWRGRTSHPWPSRVSGRTRTAREWDQSRRPWSTCRYTAQRQRPRTFHPRPLACCALGRIRTCNLLIRSSGETGH